MPIVRACLEVLLLWYPASGVARGQKTELGAVCLAGVYPISVGVCSLSGCFRIDKRVTRRGSGTYFLYNPREKKASLFFRLSLSHRHTPGAFRSVRESGLRMAPKQA
jgi:hypothetical protein